ncbi:MAG: cyclase family protein [Chloroflexota bacterium]
MAGPDGPRNTEWDMGWQDISVPIRNGMVTFEGDPKVHLQRASSMDEGGICNVSRLDFGVHSGTHVDAPVHFINGAAGVEAVAIDALVGPALVVDARAFDGPFGRASIEALGIPAGTARLLFRSRNSELWSEPVFTSSFSGVTEDGARALIDLGVRLVGIDYLSIAPFGDPTPTHAALLAADVVILEGLDLRAVEPGEYDLVCLPILIPGSDGGPARAIVRRREE